MESKKSPIQLMGSNGSLLCCGAVVFCATVVALCGSNAPACFAVIATDGIVALGWVATATLLGMTLISQADCQMPGCLRVAASGGLGLGIYSLAGLGLGLAGWLNHGVAILIPIASVMVFLIDLLRRRRTLVKIDRSDLTRWITHPAGAAWVWLLPIIPLGAACVSASLLPGILWKPLDPHPYDVTSYHLLVPREWFEGGRIVPLAHNVFSYFPFNVEMQFLLLMHVMGGPWSAMYVCQFLNVGYAVLMVLAVSGSAIDLHAKLPGPVGGQGATAPDLGSKAAATLVALVPWTVMVAGVAYVESGLMLYTALAIAIAVRGISTTAKPFKLLVLSGIMAGLACGVKITAVPMLLVPMSIGCMLCLRSGCARRAILAGCAIFAMSGLLLLSPWLIRNYCWNGNPLFPIAMHLLGHGAFSTQQIQRFVSAHSPTPAQQPFAARIAILWNDVLVYWQFGFVLLPTAVLCIVWRWRHRQMWFISFTGAVVLVVWIGFTHLLPRFLVMLIPIGGIAVAQIRWQRLWPVLGLVLLGAVVNLWWYVFPELVRHSNPAPVNGQSQPAIFGIEDTSFMNSPELDDARSRGMQVGLVGDAQAFLYNIPMSHLHYKTVFDIGPGDAVNAWTGPGVKGNPDWLLVINPAEIDRLHHTYVGVPQVPVPWVDRGPQPFFVRGSDLTP